MRLLVVYRIAVSVYERNGYGVKIRRFLRPEFKIGQIEFLFQKIILGKSPTYFTLYVLENRLSKIPAFNGITNFTIRHALYEIIKFSMYLNF